jgi:hypothetical protein
MLDLIGGVMLFYAHHPMRLSRVLQNVRRQSFDFAEAMRSDGADAGIGANSERLLDRVDCLNLIDCFSSFELHA